MSPDRFLASYFRGLERAASPRRVAESSVAGSGRSAPPDTAGRAWSIAVFAAAEARMPEGAAEVLRRYYLALSSAHLAIVIDEWASSVEAVPEGEAPATDVELHSFVSWSRMCRDLGLSPSKRNRDRLLGLWRAGRRAMREELARR